MVISVLASTGRRPRSRGSSQNQVPHITRTEQGRRALRMSELNLLLGEK